MRKCFWIIFILNIDNVCNYFASKFWNRNKYIKVKFCEVTHFVQNYKPQKYMLYYCILVSYNIQKCSLKKYPNLFWIFQYIN